MDRGQWFTILFAEGLTDHKMLYLLVMPGGVMVTLILYHPLAGSISSAVAFRKETGPGMASESSRKASPYFWYSLSG